MLAILIEKVGGFFMKHLSVILSVGAGLLVLLRIKSYIETNAVTRAQASEFQDAINRIKKNREFNNEYKENINSLDRDDIISVMHEHSEFRYAPD